MKTRLEAFATPPPPHHDSELHAYISELEDLVLHHGGTLPAQRPLILGPFRERVKNKVAWKSFTAGAVAAMIGGFATHPIDVVKVRQQIFGSKDGFGYGSSWVAKSRTTSFFSVTKTLILEEGALGLYRGVSAGLLRQASFVGTKFVLYEQLKQLSVLQNEERHLSFPARIGCGLLAGTGGAMIGNPFDLSMVRMQADGKLPENVRRNYNNGIDAIYRISKEEGISTLWRGCEATVARGAIITASQFAIYDQSKYELARFGLITNGTYNSIGASLIASIASGLVSNPFDVAKSRLFQMQKRTKDGQWPYKGMIDCMVKTGKSEGIVALWRGLGACIGRQIPLNAIRFLVMEQMTLLLKN